MIKAISTFLSPQVRAYFHSFMGRNQFKKVRSRPLKSRRGKKTYAKDCGVCSSFVPVCSNSDFANWNNWNKSHFFRKKPS